MVNFVEGMSTITKQIRTDKFYAELTWTGLTDWYKPPEYPRVFIHNLIIEVDEDKRKWSEDLFKQTLRDVAVELSKNLPQLDLSRFDADASDPSIYKIDINKIKLRYAEGYFILLHNISDYLRDLIDYDSTITSLARGEFNTGVIFPEFNDEFIRNTNATIRKFKILSQQIKKIKHYRGVDIDIRSCRVSDLTRKTSDGGPYLYSLEFRMEVVVWVPSRREFHSNSEVWEVTISRVRKGLAKMLETLTERATRVPTKGYVSATIEEK